MERTQHEMGENPALLQHYTITNFLNLQTQNKEVGDFQLKNLNR
jgi:hypothetical protein